MKANFPRVKKDQLLKSPKKKTRWQVLCGDTEHWRVGLYSPEFASRKEITKFEKHSCPEFFILLEGKVSLAIKDKRGKVRTVSLKPMRPILVEDWHNGFCPDGAFTGTALVIERDVFATLYQPADKQA